MDDFIYQVKLKQIENCADVEELTSEFSELLKKGFVYADLTPKIDIRGYEFNYMAILYSSLTSTIYTRLLELKQTIDLDNFGISFPIIIDKEQMVKNLKAFHGLI